MRRGGAPRRRVSNVGFARMDAEQLALPDASFDVALCALGLMYVPDPARALARDAARAAAGRPHGRWRCGASDRAAAGRRCSRSSMPRSPATCARCSSASGSGDALARACAEARLRARSSSVASRRTLRYADADEACDAAFVGGPVALAWSRFGDEVRARVRARYLEAIAAWRHGGGFAIPGEFVIVAAVAGDAVR